MRTMTRISLLALLAPIAVATAATAATAQDTREPWAPFLGCWTPAGSTTSSSARCIVPGEAATTVDIIDVREGESQSQSTLVADGERHAMAADGCTGWELARFSDDGARLYISAEMTCNDGPLQRTSGIFAISSTGEWIDVNGVAVGEQQSLQVRRSHVVHDLASMPTDIRDRLEPRARAYSAERIAASMDLSIARVIDASGAVDGRVVEGWIVESSRDAEQAAPVTAEDLETMSAAGVSDHVVDIMVALTYPESFHVAVARGGAGEISSVEPLVDGTMNLNARPGAPFGFDPLLMSPECGYLGYGWGSTRDRLYCSSFGYGSLWSGRSAYDRYRYGFGGGYGYGYPGYGYPVTIIVRPTDGSGGAAEPRGRVVKGSGYSRPGSTGTDAVARPRTTPEPSVRSSGSSSTSRAGRKSGSSSSTEQKRTAKPRKP